MRSAKLVLGLALVLMLSACSISENVKRMDRQLDDLDQQIDAVEAKSDRGPDDELELDRLYGIRDTLQEERDTEAAKINAGTSIGGTLLRGLAILLGVPLLVGIGEAVGRIRISKRGKRERKPK